MSTPSIAERVAAGVAWQDVNDAGWWEIDKIDVDELNMAHPCYCVLGQRHGNYYAAPITVEQAVAMGFDTAAGAAMDVPRMNSDEDYATRVTKAQVDEFDGLTAEWVRIIEERRQAAGEAS